MKTHATANANGIAVWPPHWPDYYNSGSEPCDIAIGPCLCGAWHGLEEFAYDPEKGVLYRCGKAVAERGRDEMEGTTA